MLVLVVGAGADLYDEIAGAPVPCARLGGVGSLLLVVLVVLEALALDVCIGLLLLVVVVALVALALGPCRGFACSVVLAAVRVVVVVVVVVVVGCNPCVRLEGVGSLLLVVLVVLAALALGPCVGLVIVLVLGRELAAVV